MSTIEDAQTEAEHAAREVQELEARVVDGDSSVTVSVLEKARDAARFAQLKVKSAVRGVEKEQRAEHDAAVEKLRADYDAFLDDDLDPIRESYKWAVINLAELNQAIARRKREADSLTGRAVKLGLVRHTAGGNNAPFRDDANNWRRLKLGPEFVDYAISEAKRGYPTGLGAANGNKPITHVLHTDERKEQINTLTGSDKFELAQKYLAEMVAAAVAEGEDNG